MRTRSQRQGYSMVELLVVLGVLAVLALIVGFGYAGMSRAGSTAECGDSIRAVRTQFKTWKIRNGSYPTSGNFESFLNDTHYFPEKPGCPDAGTYSIGSPDTSGVPTVSCSIHGAP